MRALAVLVLALLPAIVGAQTLPGSPFQGGSGGGGSFDPTAGVDFSGQTNVCGPDATTNVEIGSCANNANAGTGGQAVVIGDGATNANNQLSIVIGASASLAATSSASVLVGPSATATGINQVHIGYAATGTGADSISMGRQAVTNFADSIAIGFGVSSTAANQFIAAYPVGTGITDVYFNKGVASATATGWTLHGTGGSGTNNAGGALTIAPGIGTGTAVGGQVVLQRAEVTTTGSSAQALLPAYISCPSKILSNTSATAQTLATITTTTTSAGSVTMFYTVTASDGTIVDADAASINVAWNNNAGTVAATAGAILGVANSVVAPDTLAATPTATVATNVVSLKVTPTWANTTPTLVRGYATFLVNGVNSVVCQ